MERTETHAQLTMRAFRLAMRLLHEIAACPDRAEELAARRFTFGIEPWPNGVGASPIGPTTATHLLREPHPMAGCTVPGALVGDTKLDEEWILTGRTTPVPMGLIPSRDGRAHLGTDWHLTDYTESLDESMPLDVRERIALRLETAGAQPDAVPKGEAGCRTTGRIRLHSERVLPGDQLMCTHDLAWPPVALAAMVRERGLVIDPELLLQRFNIMPDGRKPAILPSSHA